MLTRIKRIKNLGVFGDYTSAAELPPFGRYNIVYGENGSGKTTLSRLLACLGMGEHPDYPNLEYSIESQSGALARGVKYTRKIRVFNSDYVEANIGRFDGPLRHILILGEENKALAEELKAEIELRDARIKRIQAIETEVAKLEADKGKLFSQIAKTIGEATSGATLRSYRKPDAVAAFAKIFSAKELSEAALEVHRTTVRQEQMLAVEPLKVPVVAEIAGKASVIDSARGAALRAKALTMRSAQSSVIERLAQNPQIAEWVEEGVRIHAGHSQGRCEFCEQPLTAYRLQMLADHFSVEDQQLKEELEVERRALGRTLQALNTFVLPDRLAFYSELRSDYDAAMKSFLHELDELKTELNKINEKLGEKLTLRTKSYDPDFACDPASLEVALDALQSVVTRHNNKTKKFSNEKDTARAAVEGHYLLSIKAQVDGLTTQAEMLQNEATLLRDGGEGLSDKRSLEALSQSIATKQAKVSDAHAGGADLTDHLKQFLGRTDLRFESGEDGYRVLRRGKPAKRLSEGEKTAIAFLYFLVQLKDQSFDLAEGVVVIDDPISSLDASAIYQAFSFLKNETQAAKQLLIFTHNFEFLRLLINWVRNLPGVPKSDRTYSMVLCFEAENGRTARLAPLDKLLIEHSTEYHYMFKVLYTFKSDGTISGCYHIPNIARKVLEAFLDFYVPSNKSLYQKLDEVNFDPHKKTAIYKFANDLSHFNGKSFDPAIVAEVQKNTEYLLEMIKAVAPLHYNGLKALCGT